MTQSSTLSTHTTSNRKIATVLLKVCVAVCLVTTLAACVAPNPPLYRWGEYESVIYTGYKNPGSSDPVTDADIIAADIERTQAEGKQVPPGVRVHLGYLYFQQGRNDEARALFETERDVFPESEIFVNGLISRMESQ
ncbi:DUF4810 domain-containing protein [Granulosicoccus sp.]|nr:DUF4810 domain-containing protein [Granulosicoccus sp.]